MCRPASPRLFATSLANLPGSVSSVPAPSSAALPTPSVMLPTWAATVPMSEAPFFTAFHASLYHAIALCLLHHAGAISMLPCCFASARAFSGSFASTNSCMSSDASWVASYRASASVQMDLAMSPIPSPLCFSS